jgi:predicted KAP-like P-loop ATPase
MLNWGLLIARLISAIGSWVDASNLRNHVYELKDENEILKTALEDILRMDPEGRLGWHAKLVTNQIVAITAPFA